jgi:hypothetical protein
VRETDETVLSSAHGSSPSLNNIYSWISWPWKMWPTACLETSVRNYHYIFRNIAEEGRSQLPITSFVKFFGPLTVKYHLSLIVHNKM